MHFSDFRDFWRISSFDWATGPAVLTSPEEELLLGFRTVMCGWGADFEKPRGTLFSVQYIVGAGM